MVDTVQIVNTKTAKWFICLIFLLQDGRNGQPKVKRLKAVEDVGMTSSDSDEKDTIYGALVVVG